MRRPNNGKWLLGFLVAAALLVPGVVAAKQGSAPAARRPAAELVAVPAALTPAVSMCFNNPCTSHQQCKVWCDDPGAICVQQPGGIGRRCVLQ